MPVEDSYIASTAKRHSLTIVTGNDQDFRRRDLKVFNPFKERPATLTSSWTALPSRSRGGLEAFDHGTQFGRPSAANDLH